MAKKWISVNVIEVSQMHNFNLNLLNIHWTCGWKTGNLWCPCNETLVNILLVTNSWNIVIEVCCLSIKKNDAVVRSSWTCVFIYLGEFLWVIDFSAAIPPPLFSLCGGTKSNFWLHIDYYYDDDSSESFWEMSTAPDTNPNIPWSKKSPHPIWLDTVVK